MQFLAMGSLLAEAKDGPDDISNMLLNTMVRIGIDFMGGFQRDELSISKSTYLCRGFITLTHSHAILRCSLKVKAQLCPIWGGLCLGAMHRLTRAVLFQNSLFGDSDFSKLAAPIQA